MRGIIFLRLIVVATLLCTILGVGSADVLAGEQEAAAPPTERTHLLGDWGGARTSLAKHGIIVDAQLTQFYQGVVDGSSGSNDGQYGVKGDLFLTLIGEQLGLWKGLIINAHLESRAGDDVNAISGLSPGNAAMLMPDSDDTTALTQLIAIQMVSKQVGVITGKLNAFDFVDMVYHMGRGVDGFMNTSMTLPIGLGGTLGLGLPLGFLVKFKGKEVQGFAGVYDPNSCATTSCLDPLLADGPAYAAMWKFYLGGGEVGPRSSYASFGGTYSTKDYTVVDPGSFYVNPGVGLSLTKTSESWSIFSVLSHELWADPSSTDRFLNFKGLYTITDGEANPIQWSATAALEMNGPFRRRSKDVVGIGYFHTELSSGFKGLVGPVLSVAATLKNRMPTRINIEDTDGFEAYYKAQVTPWLAVTADLQVITETLSSEDTKIVAGVRGKVTF
jgi:porin